IFRQVALRLSRVTPLDLGNGRYVLDPSGRDVALFRPGLRGDPQNWRPVREWEIAAPIPCRLLNDASFILPEDGIPAGLEPQLAPPPSPALLLDPTRGRVLLTAALPAADALYVEAIHLGAFGEIGAGSYDRRAGLARDNVTVFDPGPQDGNGNDLSPGPVTGFALPFDGIHEFADSKTYVPDPPAANLLGPIDQLTLQARDRTRPYIRLVPDAAASEITFAGPAPAAPPRSLTIDGLWIGIVPSGLAEQNLPDEASECTPVETRIIIDGIFDRVTIRRATLDPGGGRARLETKLGDPIIGVPIPYLAVEVRGQVAELVIDRAIVGPVRESSAAGDPCS